MPNHRPSVRRRSRLPLPGLRLCSEGWFIATIRGKFLTRRYSRPVLVQKGHHDCAEACPLLGVKRTLLGDASMSANDPKRTFAARGGSPDTKARSAGI